MLSLAQSFCAKDPSQKLSWELFLHSQYSPDFASFEYPHFSGITNHQNGLRLKSIEECKHELESHHALQNHSS